MSEGKKDLIVARNALQHDYYFAMKEIDRMKKQISDQQAVNVKQADEIQNLQKWANDENETDGLGIGDFVDYINWWSKQALALLQPCPDCQPSEPAESGLEQEVREFMKHLKRINGTVLMQEDVGKSCDLLEKLLAENVALKECLSDSVNKSDADGLIAEINLLKSENTALREELKNKTLGNWQEGKDDERH